MKNTEKDSLRDSNPNFQTPEKTIKKTYGAYTSYHGRSNTRELEHHASKKKDPYEENLLEHVEFEHQLYFKSMNTSSLTQSFRIF